MSKSLTTKSKTTQELLIEREEIYELIRSNDGELPEELEKSLTANVQAIERKTDSIHYAVQRLEADGEFFKAQAKAYADAAKARQNAAKRIKDHIKFLMTANEINRIAGESVEYFLANAAPVMEGEGVPTGYELIVTETLPDKERIRAALVEGRSVEGYRLSPNFSLRSRMSKK